MMPARPRFLRWNALILFEFAAITALALLFSAFILAGSEGLELRYLDSGYRLDAIEHERLSGIMIPVELGLGLSSRASGIGHLPTWNPYLGVGTPLINNGFFYLFNPFMSLPMLLQGAVTGGKIDIVIGFLLAGYSMWALARAVGLGALARVTTAALYLMNGGMIAKLSSGHFQLGLSLVWPPLIFAGLLWTLKTRDRRAPILMALAFALLFFSGNIYYTLHVIMCCALITLAYSLHREEGRWHLDRDAVRRVAIGGALGLGLTMIQFLPVWVTRGYVNHVPARFDPDTGQFTEQISLSLNAANFLLPWEGWRNLTNPPLALQVPVHYNYIGPLVFLWIAGLAFTVPRGGLLRRYGRIAGLALVLALGMMIWGAGQTIIVETLYRNIPLLAEFRYLGRANAIAGLWWILLGGMALDSLWRWLAGHERPRLLLALGIPVALWGLFVIYSLGNNSTRLAMSLYNLNLFNFLNTHRFSSYAQAADVLVQWIVLALVIDTLLRVLRHLRAREALLRVLRVRLLRAGLLLLALAAIFDVMYVNQALFQFKVPEGNFGGLYAEALSVEAANGSRLPIILEPFTSNTYDAYYSRIRTWGLHEGWIPLAVDGDLIPKGAPKLVSLPGWAIVSTEYGRGAVYTLAQEFVDSNPYVVARCVGRNLKNDDPCDLANEAASALYHLPEALPYAFVASAQVLQSQADTITGANVDAANVLSLDLDTITIQATSTHPRDYLIVQETDFPGWQAEMDGQAVQPVPVGYQIPQGDAGKFIGVPMQPGTHLYTLRFYPPGFNLGAILSGLTLILLLLYLLGIHPPRLRRPATEQKNRTH